MTPLITKTVITINNNYNDREANAYVITAFKLLAELRRTFSREKKKKKRGSILFSLSHMREAKLPANKMS